MPLNKAEQQQRKALAQAVSGALKQQVRGTAWRVSRGWLFRQNGDWFVEVHCDSSVIERKTTAEFRAKPMALDPLFWEIVRAPELVGQPLSFRMHGAWTCHGPAWAHTEIPELDSTPDEIAARILNWATDQLNEPPIPFDHTAFIDLLKGQPELRASKGAWFACLVTALALDGKLEDVRAVCQAAIERGEPGGYSVGDLSFPALVLAWLECDHKPRIAH